MENGVAKKQTKKHTDWGYPFKEQKKAQVSVFLFQGLAGRLN